MNDKYNHEEYKTIEKGIRERVNAASKGPWVVHQNDVSTWIEDLRGIEIVRHMPDIENATFIAYARTDINRLLAHIDILEKRNREYVHVILDLTMQIARTELEQEEER